MPLDPNSYAFRKYVEGIRSGSTIAGATCPRCAATFNARSSNFHEYRCLAPECGSYFVAAAGLPWREPSCGVLKHADVLAIYAKAGRLPPAFQGIELPELSAEEAATMLEAIIAEGEDAPEDIFNASNKAKTAKTSSASTTTVTMTTASSLF